MNSKSFPIVVSIRKIGFGHKNKLWLVEMLCAYIDSGDSDMHEKVFGLR